MAVRIRPAVAGVPSYRPGRAAPGSGLSDPDLKLSSNENPYAPLPSVLEAVTAACGQMNRYPDLSNQLLAQAVGERLGIGPERLSFATGSVGVLYHLLHAICEPGDEVVYAWRSFEAYPIAIQLTGATPVPVALGEGAIHDLAALHAAVTPATRAVLLCTPNNPTGPALPHAEVVAMIDSLPDDVAVLIDEAYVEFVTDPTAVRGLDFTDRENVVLLRTFSKAYGLAGFRVGYAVASPELAGAARAVALPFGVSTPAQAAVLAALDAEAEMWERVRRIVADRDALATDLRALGFPVPDTQANFVWLPSRERTQNYADAFASAGLAVRPYLAGDEHDGIRITVGVPSANARVLEVAADLPR